MRKIILLEKFNHYNQWTLSLVSGKSCIYKVYHFYNFNNHILNVVSNVPFDRTFGTDRYPIFNFFNRPGFIYININVSVNDTFFIHELNFRL